MKTLGMTLIGVMCVSGAGAVDGVLEINQTCAAGPGCFAGDTAGFPVQIANPGSYRLTSNLNPAVFVGTVAGISIGSSATGVTLDLNGFAIVGPNTTTGFPASGCTAQAAGEIGVTSAAHDVVVVNGSVRGMGDKGIYLPGVNGRVERVIVDNVCGDGITVGNASLVIHSVARANRNRGIVAAATSRVIDSVADANGGGGILNSDNSLTVENCTANANGNSGIAVFDGSLVRGSSAIGNTSHGIATTSGPAQVLQSIAMGNGGVGIIVGGMTGVGLNNATGNTGGNLIGGIAVACNVTGGTQVCPP